jgi:hypothetical protein
LLKALPLTPRVTSGFIARTIFRSSAARLSRATLEDDRRVKWQPIGGDVSQRRRSRLHARHVRSDDENERGSYVRIWKKQNGMWRIVMDVTNSISHKMTHMK